VNARPWVCVFCAVAPGSKIPCCAQDTKCHQASFQLWIWAAIGALCTSSRALRVFACSTELAAMRLCVQGVNPWIEVDGGVGPANAYKVSMCFARPRNGIGRHCLD
jgi:hypothetical protein